MPMTEPEQALVARRRARVEALVQELHAAPWQERAAAAGAQLDAIHGDWWARHLEAPGGYATDLRQLNEAAAWSGPFASLSTLERAGRTYLTPPKFFGGNASGLDPDFVLSIALNHATPTTDDYLDELAAFQSQPTALIAHRDYFEQPYVYGRFFKPRARLLSAYAEARGHGVPADWRQVNARYSLYLERYPTLSPKCRPAVAPHALLESRSFVMGLNSLAHRVVLALLRPRAVLLAGRDTHALLPTAAPRAVGPRIRPSQAPVCPATLDEVVLAPGLPPCRVLRTNFIRSQLAPNSTEELEAAGRLLAGREAR